MLKIIDDYNQRVAPNLTSFEKGRFLFYKIKTLQQKTLTVEKSFIRPRHGSNPWFKIFWISGQIHSDINDGNVLVELDNETGEYKVSTVHVTVF